MNTKPDKGEWIDFDEENKKYKYIPIYKDRRLEFGEKSRRRWIYLIWWKCLKRNRLYLNFCFLSEIGTWLKYLGISFFFSVFRIWDASTMLVSRLWEFQRMVSEFNFLIKRFGWELFYKVYIVNVIAGTVGTIQC